MKRERLTPTLSTVGSGHLQNILRLPGPITQIDAHGTSQLPRKLISEPLQPQNLLLRVLSSPIVSSTYALYYRRALYY